MQWNDPTRSGTGHFKQLIEAADAHRHILSFNNLVEAHVLRPCGPSMA
jgi:hypothetical protein